MKPVTIRLVRSFPHPPAAAYGWLTDFRADDVERAGAVISSREVLERSAERVVYRGAQNVLGVKSHGTTEVLLHPPDAWEARVIDGPRLGSRTTYRLAGAGAGSTLTVQYDLTLQDPRRQRLLRLLKPLVRRELAAMWKGYERAMAADLTP